MIASDDKIFYVNQAMMNCPRPYKHGLFMSPLCILAHSHTHAEVGGEERINSIK